MGFPLNRNKSVFSCLALWIAGSALANGVTTLDATHVRLLPGSPFYGRQELPRKEYLAAFNPDRLLYEFRKQAGFPQLNGMTSFCTGWDSSWIRGHMAGHYLSAAFRMAAATGYASFRETANYMVAELAKCQKSLDQSVGPADWMRAFPNELESFKAPDVGPSDDIVFRSLHEGNHQRYSLCRKMMSDGA